MADERCIVIEHDGMTGNKRRLDNMASSPWADTFTRAEADEMVAWRKANITSKYSYEIRPVIAWCLDIEDGVHHDLFMAALGTDFREEDPFDPPRVCVRRNELGHEVPGGLVWAYTRKGTSSPPEWLVSLCAFFEDQGLKAGIRRP